jgi:hypothetical protein
MSVRFRTRCSLGYTLHHRLNLRFTRLYKKYEKTRGISGLERGRLVLPD